jgi:hypothetical protein
MLLTPPDWLDAAGDGNKGLHFAVGLNHVAVQA